MLNTTRKKQAQVPFFGSKHAKIPQYGTIPCTHRYCMKSNLMLDTSGQANIAAGAITALVSVIVVIVVTIVYVALNKEALDTQSRALLDLVPLLLSAGVVIAIVAGFLVFLAVR